MVQQKFASRQSAPQGNEDSLQELCGIKTKRLAIRQPMWQL